MRSKSLHAWSVVAGVTALGAIITSLANEQETAAHESKIRAKLSIANPQITIGQVFSCHVEIKNESRTEVSIFDAGRSLVPHERCVFVLYDHNNERIGNIHFQGRIVGGSFGPFFDKSYWIRVPPGGGISFEARCRMWFSIEGQVLSPGPYKIKLRFLDTFLSEYPYSESAAASQPKQKEERDQWMRDHPGKEIFGTNVIDVILIK
jgi:hypothetical protein